MLTRRRHHLFGLLRISWLSVFVLGGSISVGGEERISPTTGSLHFPITTSSHEAQAFFDQGIKYLLGLWYQRAEHCFRRAALVDPECAMAYWGRAMANVESPSYLSEYLDQAKERMERASARERRWIRALESIDLGAEADVVPESIDTRSWNQHWIRHLREIVAADAREIEAKAFLVFYLLEESAESDGLATAELESLVSAIRTANPRHPIEFFRERLWDPEEREAALTSATRCVPGKAGVAPLGGIPGELDARAQNYLAAIAIKEESIRLDNASIMELEFHENNFNTFADTRDTYIRMLISQGRVREAIDTAKRMIDFPRHPNFNRIERLGSCASYGRLRLMESLTEFELWDELLRLAETEYLQPIDNDYDGVMLHASLARASFHLDRIEGVREARLRIQAIRRKASFAASADDGGQSSKKKTVTPSDIASLLLDTGVPLRLVESALSEADLYLALLENRRDGVKALVSQVSHLSPSSLARLHWLTGDKNAALGWVDQAISNSSQEVLTLATAAELYHQAERTVFAQAALNGLAQAVAKVDLKLPFYQRIDRIAQQLDQKDFWVKETSSNVTLNLSTGKAGSIKWRPAKASEWQLKTADGQTKRLSDYRGRPLLLVFYLGYGCAHCVEQLVLLYPRADDFEKLGISLAAISTETQEELAEALAKSDVLGELPFPLVANSEKNVFKDYHAYDLFEDAPLHGVYLIDREGYIRWRDISSEPFTGIDFLLAESQRLLGSSSVD